MNKRIAFIYFIVVALAFFTLPAKAQPGSTGDPLPCDPDDPNCPIDTWVWIPAAAIVAGTAWHVQKKKKLSATGNL